MSYEKISKENIVIDNNSGIAYPNNQILVTLDNQNSKRNLTNYLKQFNCKIVGSIDRYAQYQIKFDKTFSYLDICKLIEKLKENSWIKGASPNLVIKFDNIDNASNDEKWIDDWDEIPDGKNWWIETIEAAETWHNKDKMEFVNIGVIDTMFDTNHEDLDFSEIPLGNVLALKNNKFNSDQNNHGTHVAGIIGATNNNFLGISGVSIKSNMYGVSMKGIEICEYTSLMDWKIALTYLISLKKCNVVNISLGYDWLSFEADRGTPTARKIIEQWSQELGDYIELLIQDNPNFVICKSAGNQNKEGGGYQYFKKDDSDVDYSSFYNYYPYSDYCKYLEGKLNDEEFSKAFSKYKDRKKEIKSKLDSGNVDVMYDLFAFINNPCVKDRIIIVGAIKNNGYYKAVGFFGIGGNKVHKGYSIADFSQCGNRVDILGPGVNIYSTIKNGYQNMSGTSQATPYVSGVAGLIYSTNHDLSGN